MWILKNSKELLDHLSKFQPDQQHQALDWSTYYTTIPRQKLKSRHATITTNFLFTKIKMKDTKFLVLGCEELYFVKKHSDSNSTFTEDDIINMLEFQVDIFVVFGGNVFRQIVVIPMGTNCDPRQIYIVLYSYEAEFTQSLLSVGKKGKTEVQRDVRNSKSGNKTSSREIGINIRTFASPEVGQDQVSGGVSVLCWHAAPVANVLWKPLATR